MKKIDELNKKLNPIYSELVNYCLEYVDSMVDTIYIMGINVGNSHFSNSIFFKLNNEYFEIHTIGTRIEKEISSDEHFDLLEKLYIFMDMYKLYIEYTGESPTEVKLKYNVTTGKFGVKLSYDDRIEKSDFLTPNAVFNEWFEEAKSGNDGFDW